MKVSRIIPKIESPRQKVSSSTPQGDFQAVFQSILASQTAEVSPNVAENPSSIPEGALQKTENILLRLESLIKGELSPLDLQSLKEEALSLFQDLAQLHPGPSRQALEEVALLGVVEAEKRLV